MYRNVYAVAKTAQKTSATHAAENIDMGHLYSPNTQCVLFRAKGLFTKLRFNGRLV